MGSQWEDKKKPHLNIVFVGHADHGKSTTVGRLLLDTGHIEQHVVDKFEEEAKERFTQLRYLLEEEINIPYTVDVIDLKRASPAFKEMVLKEAKRWI
jgi:elongation factor 1-alpha